MKYEHAREFEDQPGRSTGNIFTPVTDALDRLSVLMEHLPAVRTPTRHATEYGFFARSEAELSYPETLRDALYTRELTDIQVSITREEGLLPATTIVFNLKDLDSTAESAIYVSRSLDAGQDAEYSMLVTGDAQLDYLIQPDGSPVPLPKIPNNQLNAFLYTLVGEHEKSIHPHVDPEEYLVLDATDIEDRLSKSAISEVSDYTFDLDDQGTRTITYRTSKHGANELLDTLVFSYETGNIERTLSVTIDKSEGLKLSYNTVDSTTGLASLIPDEGDYIRLTEVLDEEIKKLEN